MLQAACPRRKIPAAPSLAPPNHVLTNEIHTARNGSQLFEAPSTRESERLLGKAALALWSDLPRDVQEKSKLLWPETFQFETIWLRTCTTTIRKRRHPAKP